MKTPVDYSWYILAAVLLAIGAAFVWADKIVEILLP